jgi:hypothetical protein
MRISPIHPVSTLIIVLALGGCATPPWNTTPGPQRSEKLAVTADLPPGWARFNPDAGLLFTKDGILIQAVQVRRDKYGARMKNTDRVIDKGAEPQEAAQLLIDALMADQEKPHLAVIDNRPATVGGHPGFRLEVTYKTTEGLTMHETIYVALTGESYVIIRYRAPERHYQERSAGDFERIVTSIKIDEQPAKS